MIYKHDHCKQTRTAFLSASGPVNQFKSNSKLLCVFYWKELDLWKEWKQSLDD